MRRPDVPPPASECLTIGRCHHVPRRRAARHAPPLPGGCSARQDSGHRNRTTYAIPTACPITLQRPLMRPKSRDRPRGISTPFNLSEVCTEGRSGKRRRLGTVQANRRGVPPHGVLSCARACRLPIGHRKSLRSGWARWTGQPVCRKVGPPVGLCKSGNADRAPVTEARMMHRRSPQRAWILFPNGWLLVGTRGYFDS